MKRCSSSALILRFELVPAVKFTDGDASVCEVEIARSWQEIIFVFTASNSEPAIPCLLLENHPESSRFYFGSVTLREREELGPIAPEWRLFLNVSQPDSFKSVPDELIGPNGIVPVQTVSMQDGTLNLAELVEGFQERTCAVLYKSFESPTEGTLRLGVSADWWLELYCNGELIYSTLPAGNNSGKFIPEDHPVEIPLRAGRNLLAVKVLSGSGGWRFVMGSSSVWTRSAYPKGEILSGDFSESMIFPGTTRTYSVYIPKQYDPSLPACLYVSQDGHHPEFTNAMDVLIDEKEMPVTVGVFISPGVIKAPSEFGGDRSNRCYEYDSLGDHYVRFLLEELLPFVVRKYQLNLSEDGNDRAIGGCSSGGICAFNAAWERPDSFRRVYSNSGSFVAFRGGNVLPALIRKYEAKPIRVFTHVATQDMENSGGHWWFANQEFERALAFSGYDYLYRWCEGGHGAQYREGFPEAMRWLWRDYPAPIMANPGPPRIQDIFLPEEPWQLVVEGFKNTGSITANVQGDVLLCDLSANQIYKIENTGKGGLFCSDAGQVNALTSGVDGSLYGVSKVTGKVLAFSEDGLSREIASGVPGSSIAAAHDGGFYVAGRQDGKGIVWRVEATGESRVVDTGLRDATGVAVSIDGWVLYVADGASHFVYAYRINADGSLTGKERMVWLHVPDDADDSGAEAVACVSPANLIFVATRMGLQTSDRVGHNQCIIPAPKGKISGFCFGGPAFDTLYVCCGDRVFKRKVKVRGHHAFHPAIKPEGGDL